MYLLHKCVRFRNKPFLGLLHGSLARPYVPLQLPLATSESLDVKVNYTDNYINVDYKLS